MSDESKAAARLCRSASDELMKGANPKRVGIALLVVADMLESGEMTELASKGADHDTVMKAVIAAMLTRVMADPSLLDKVGE
jgi:hypothetical protein